MNKPLPISRKLSQGLKGLSLSKIKAERCRRDFFYFIQEFWDLIIAETPVYNWHIPFLAKELQGIAERVKRREKHTGDLIINIPPGTTKSTLVSVMLPAWIWTIDPTIRVLTASHNDTLSIDLSVKSRDIIQSARYKEYFPEIALREDISGKSHYKNTLGGDRVATSVGSSIIGFHAHLILVDDPIDAKKSGSEAYMKQANDFMDKTLSTRKVDKDMTPTVLVMQRLHHADPTANWLNKKDKKLRHICLPGELSKDVKPPEAVEHYKDGYLDPVRLSKQTLASMKVDLGSYGYAGQVQQTPSDDEGGIWQASWFRTCKRSEINLAYMMSIGTDWDTAYTTNELNAANAYVTSCVHRGTKDIYILDAGFFWAETPELVKNMAKQRAPHYVEAKASGKSAAQFLKRRGINAIEVKMKEGDKVMRTRQVTPTVESGRVIVAEEIIDVLLNDQRQGILSFPLNQHMDLNDAFVQALHRHGGSTVSDYRILESFIAQPRVFL